MSGWCALCVAREEGAGGGYAAECALNRVSETGQSLMMETHATYNDMLVILYKHDI